MRQWLQNLGFLAVPLVFLSLVSALGGPSLPLLTLISGLFLAVLVHELGHAFAGALMGMRITGIVLGPFELDRATGPVRPRWNRRLRASGALIFESNAELPAKAVDAWRWTILAGPLTNLLLAILLAWLNLTVFAGQPDEQAKLAIIAAVNAVFGAISFLPLTWGLTASDGAILRRIWEGGAAAEQDMRAQQLGKWLASSIRPCQWPAADLAIADYLLAAPPSTLDSNAEVVAIVYKYCYLADCGDLRAALSVLEAAVPSRTLMSKRLPWHPIDLVIVLLARHYALWGNDTERAHMLLDMLHPISWVRSDSEWKATTALVRLSKGNRADALSFVTQARQQVKPLVDRFGVVKMESDWLDRAEQRIRSQMTAPAVAPAVLEAATPISQPEAFAAHRPPRLTVVESKPEPRPIPIARIPRNAWQDVAVAISSREMATFNSHAVIREFGVDRSWLYRAPGIPVESNGALGRISLPNPWAATVAPRRMSATR